MENAKINKFCIFEELGGNIFAYLIVFSFVFYFDYNVSKNKFASNNRNYSHMAFHHTYVRINFQFDFYQSKVSCTANVTRSLYFIPFYPKICIALEYTHHYKFLSFSKAPAQIRNDNSWRYSLNAFRTIY